MSAQKKIKIESDYGPKFKPILDSVKDSARYLRRRVEKGIVNKETGAAISMREDGTVGLVSKADAQYKIGDGASSEITNTSVTKTNRKIIDTDDFVINGHKLNPQIYELGDMIETAAGGILGNLTMDSTVLVKAWEPTLEKYVLIRRPARTALFYQSLNSAPVHPGLGVKGDLKEEFGVMEQEEQGASLVEKIGKGEK